MRYASDFDWALLARYLSGECTEREKAEVEEAISSDPEIQRLISSMRPVWETPEPQAPPPDVSRLWAEIAPKTGTAAGSDVARARRGFAGRLVQWLQPQPKLRIYAAAAVLLIVSSLAYHWSAETGMPLSQGGTLSQGARWSTLAVPRGSSGELTLNDGTRIRLDAGSVLRYPESFRGDREVVLSGEGFFEVEPDADHPFRVHLGHASVEVLGTRFNVRAWDTEKEVTVAVSEGRVALISEQEKKAVEIGTGQMSALRGAGPPSDPRPVDTEEHLGWMRREAFFDDAQLKDVLFQLERWHAVQFSLEDTSMAAERLTVHIKGESLESALELISVLTGLDSRREDGQVRLRSRARGG